ncbi:MAG: SMP-30/gluconolactonase/LRE family protein [Alphaproteobacteria bacterium]|nr:SMP-30/gluconolactonase/LRE family protein [Alphaproteobacteria bacterium]
MFPPPEVIETEVHARLPVALHRTANQSAWLAKRGAGPMHSFLEGPAVDRAGNLYCVDLAHGRIFRITPDRQWQVFAAYDGQPNGLKLHKDGRVFVADHQHGILAFDPATGARRPIAERGSDGARFLGLNDLSFGSEGDLYLTDQGDSSLDDPCGAVYRLRRTGEMDLIRRGFAAPNGLVLNRAETSLFVSATRTNQVFACPVARDRPGAAKTRIFLQLSGGLAGPDGMAADEADNLVVVQAGSGSVWVFSPLGEPLYRIRSCAGIRVTNVAYGDADRRSLFITEAEQGVILKARLPVPGRIVFGLS